MTAPAIDESVPHRQVALLLGAGIGYFAVAGISFPVLPRLVEGEIGGAEAAIGISFGALALGMLAVRPFVGYLSDRYGRRPTMVAGALAVAGLQLAHVPAARTGLLALVLVRVAMGMAASLMYVSQATVATEIAPASRRGQVFATFSTAVFVGFAIGPVLGEWVLENHGFTVTFAVAAVLGLASAAAGSMLPETRPAGVEPHFDGIRSLFHPIAARIGVMNLMVFMAFIGFNGFITPYAESMGVTSVRWILLTYSGTTLVLRAVGGRVLDQANRMTLATGAFITVAVGSLILAAASSVVWLYVGALVLAAGLAYNVPLLVLVGAESAPAEDRAKVVATITTFGDLANSAGALLLGFVAAGTSYSVMYLVVAMGAVGAAALLHSPFLAPVSGFRRQPATVS
ncbi:MAG: MFS transporter [Acidimicrobiia bacterium]|nr:MFS transporter [Acidimicrobiia bacterium]